MVINIINILTTINRRFSITVLVGVRNTFVQLTVSTVSTVVLKIHFEGVESHLGFK